MARKFRKKPIVIEAVQWTGNNLDEIKNFIGYSPDFYIAPIIIKIKTLEGDMDAKRNSWIIKGVEGEFYPCDDQIFNKTYEEVF